MGPHAPCAHLHNNLALHRRSVRPDAAFGKFRDSRQQPETRKPCPFHAVQQSRRRRRLLAAETGQLGAADLPPEEPEEPKFSVQVFSRIREKDPYRLLGVDQAATFEEVQDARNYLYEEFQGHGRSREAIEMAFDEILKHKMKFRHRYGFQPPSSGKRSDVQGGPKRKSLREKFADLFEPSVSKAAIINDGAVFFLLNIWSVAAIKAYGDAAMPLLASVFFCIYRLNDKRKKRNPEGPFFGNNAVFGSIFTAAIGSLVAYLAIEVVMALPIAGVALPAVIVTIPSFILAFVAIGVK